MLRTAAAVLAFVGPRCAADPGAPVVDSGSANADSSPWRWPSAACATCLSTLCNAPNPYPACQADATCVAAVTDFIDCMDSLYWIRDAIRVCNQSTTGTRQGVKIPPEASAITSLCVNEQNPCQTACIVGAAAEGGR
jgi:hypothetical protein